MLLLLNSCTDSSTTVIQETKSAKSKSDYIRPIPGKNDTIAEQIKQRGEVMIAYSDCYTCHTIDVRSKGPSFKDIAKRYPVNAAYIELLANKIITGGTGSWGYPVMTPHPGIKLEDARMMAQFILSLKE